MLFVCTLNIQKWLTINKPKTILILKKCGCRGVVSFSHITNIQYRLTICKPKGQKKKKTPTFTSRCQKYKEIDKFILVV